MEKLFLTVLGMSGTAAVVILLVLLARLALRRAPKVFSYALWAVVLFRLLCPFTIPSTFSLLPAVQTSPAGAELTRVTVYTGIAAVNIPVNDYLSEHPYPVEFTQSEREGDPCAQYLEGIGRMVGTAAPDWVFIACRVWLAGAVLLLGYGAVSLLILRRRLVGSVPLAGEKHVRLADHIPSPFVLGLFRPRIYLPSDLPEGERDYILLHERTHIRRGDHVFRALAWLALAVHWFNPLVWLAFHLAGKDMEMSCDEAVLRKMGRDVRADYSSSLLRLSTGRRLPAGPLAFGDGDPQSRIRNILSYKKPALWVMAAALILVLCAGAALATNPGVVLDSPEPVPAEFHEPGPVECWLDYTHAPQGMPWDDSMEIGLEEYPGVTFRWTPYTLTAVTEYGEETLFSGMPIWSVYLCDLTGDGKRELCAQVSFGSGLVDEHIIVYDYENKALHTLWDRGVYDYYLWQVGDQLAASERDYGGETDLRVGPLVLTASGLEIDGTQPSLSAAGLILSVEQSDSGNPLVRLSGRVGDEALERSAVWWAGGMETLFDGHSQVLSMRHRFASGGAELTAWWANEEHTAVTLSTKMSAMLSSYLPVGYWEFTVELTGGTGTVAAMDAQMGEHTIDAPLKMCPESITDAEAVHAAHIAAKLMTAAEDYYNNAQLSVAEPSAPLPTQQILSYRRPDSDGNRIIIDGLGAYVEWDNVRHGEGKPENAVGVLYFAGDPAFFCPSLAGETAEGNAGWMDQDGTILYTHFTVKDSRTASGTLSGLSMEFIVDLGSGTATQRAFLSDEEGETLELTHQEMTDMALSLAQILKGAEAYFYDE